MKRALAFFSVFCLLLVMVPVIPLAVAADGDTNLLANTLGETYVIPAGTDTKEMGRGWELEPSTAYVFRFVASGAPGQVSFVLNGGWFHTKTAQSDIERVYQYAFTTGTENLDKTWVYVTNKGESDLFLSGFALYKASADGEFNVFPGGDCSMESDGFSAFYAKGATHEPDPDNAENVVLSIPVSASNTMPFNLYAGSHMLMKISFRYKGWARFDDWMGANGCYAGAEGATGTSGTGGTYEDKPVPQYVTFRSDHAWASGSIYVFRGDGAQDAYNTIRNMSTTNPLLLDDVTITKVPEATGLEMSQTAVKVYPGNYAQLSVTRTPAFSFLPEGGVVWTSNNELVTVDQTGRVTVAATAEFGEVATITATYKNFTATCTVTVSKDASKPPLYTVVGENGFAEENPEFDLTGGSDPVVLVSNSLLKANTRYVVRFKSQSNVMGATITTNEPKMASRVIQIPQTSNWMANQFAFMTTDGGTNFTLTVTPAPDSGSTLSIRDVELWEAPTDGSFNLIPGGAFSYGYNALDSVIFTNFQNKFFTQVVDDPTEIGNKMLQVTGRDFLYMEPIIGHAFGAQALKFTFRYKGGAVDLNNWGKNVHYIDFPEGTTVLLRKENNTQIQSIRLAATDTWKTVSVTVAVQDYSQACYIQLSGADATETVYIDDFAMYEVEMVTANALVLDKSTLNLYPTDSAVVRASGKPEGAYLDTDRISWKSSNENVATVDAYGNVTAVGKTNGQTATITVMLDGVDQASCVVTIDYSAPKPPMLTEPGVNAMADVADVTVLNGAPATVDTNAILKASTRYALRFVAKATGGDAVVTANGVNKAVTVVADGNLRTYQILFTTAAQVDAFTVSVTANGSKVEISDWELYEAPVSGDVNLLAGSSMDTEVGMFANHYANGAKIVKEGNNAVLYLPEDLVTSELYIKAPAYTQGKIWKITFKAKGAVHFADWTAGATRLEQPHATHMSANKQHVYYYAEDWTTFTYYLKVRDGSQAAYLLLDNRNKNNAQVATYLDDVQFFEVDAATSMTINEQDVRLYPTVGQQLTYTFGPANTVSLGGKVQWSSNNEDVVAVDENGYVTVVGDPGQSAVITADDGVLKATTTVTADADAPHGTPITGLKIEAPVNKDIDVGQVVQLGINATPAGNFIGRVTWTSSNDRIATVSKNGVVSIYADGEVTFTAKSEFGPSDSVTFTVHKHANMLVNGDFEKGASVSWRNNAGVQAGVGVNSSYGFVVSKDNKNVYYNQALTLKPATRYEISFYYKAEKGAVGRIYTTIGAGNLGTSKYCARGELETAEWQYASKVFRTPDYWDAQPTWSIGVGINDTESEVGAQMIYDNIAIREYAVSPAITTLSIDQKDIGLAPGGSMKLTVSTNPAIADANSLIWTSSDENVAYVVSGNVIAVGAGTATITVKAKSGATTSCQVKVGGAPALLKNPTFDVESDWVLNGGAAYRAAGGVNASVGMDIRKNASLSQTFTGLKPNTAYQLKLQYRQAYASTAFDVVIADKDGNVVATFTENSRTVVYKEKVFAFTTPSTVNADGEYTLTIRNNDTAEVQNTKPLELDHLMLVEAPTDVDFAAVDVNWSNGNADQVVPGANMSFEVTVTNKGTANYNGIRDLEIDIYVDAVKVATIVRPAAAFAVGATEVLHTAVGDEWIATAGDHTITACVNSTMAVAEKDNKNNYAIENLRVTDRKNFLTAPTGAAENGYNRLAFSDDFDSLCTVDLQVTGNYGYKWYLDSPYDSSLMTTQDFTVKDSILMLRPTTSAAFDFTTYSRKNESGFLWHQGYAEIRTRFDVNNVPTSTTGWPSFWTSDVRDYTGKPWTDASELDIMEAWRYDSKDPSKGIVYSGALHHHKKNDDGTRGNGTNSNALGYKSETHRITDGWHTYGALWRDGYVAWYMDDVFMHAIEFGEGKLPVLFTRQADGTVKTTTPPASLTNWVSAHTPLNTAELVLIFGADRDWPMDVDYVRVWQEGESGAGCYEHEYDDVCDDDCNICGDVREAPHDFEWHVDSEPDCGADGKKHEECTKCGDIRNANTVIPSTGKHGYDDEYDMDCNGCGMSRANGSCGKNAYWRLENGTLIIGGSGAMSSYTSYTKTPWKEHKNNIVSLKIDKDITEIGSYAFASFLGLKQVVFEEGSVLHTIQNNAFHYCHLLESITLPDTVVSIGVSAFGYCAKLTSVYMPECAATLYKDIFLEHGKNLTLNVVAGYKAQMYAEKYGISFVTREASVPEGDALPGETVVASGMCGENATWTVYKSGKMIVSGSGAVYKYSYPDKTPWAGVKENVLSIKIGKNITEIGNYAFAAFFNCEKILFEENSVLHTLNNHSFHLSSKLKTVVLPDTVTFIGFAAFGYCEALETVYMPECAKTIYSGAFVNCNPDVVLNVVDGFVAHNYAIRNNLKYTTREALAPNGEALPGETIIGSGKCGDNATWTLYMSGKFIIEGTGALYGYSSYKTTPWVAIKEEARTIRISNGITEIGSYTLSAFYNVKRIVFEEGSKLQVLKNNAFHYSSALKELVLPDSVIELQGSAIGYCLVLEKVYIPEGTCSIYVNAFNGSNLDNLVLQVADGSYAYRYANRNNIKVEVR